MKRKFQVSSFRFQVENIKKFIGLLLLITYHLLPVTSVYADEITSAAALVMDASTGRVLFAKNPSLRLYPASTVKLMTAMVTLDMAGIDDVVTISKRATEVSPLKMNFKAGEKVTIRTLLNAALIESANDAAVALAEGVAGSEQQFVNLMNRKAASIGAEDTHFINANGLPGAGQHITAYDLSKIMRHAVRYPFLRELIGTRTTEITTENGRDIFLKNTNKLLWSNEGLIGGKTGYTRKARHCFVCAGEKDSDVVIVAVLGAQSRQTLWKESEMLLSKGFDVMSRDLQPVIYYSRADYAGVKKVAYRKAVRQDRGWHQRKRAVKGKNGRAIAKRTSKAKILAGRDRVPALKEKANDI